jgi:hypothetical protein
LYTFCEQEKQSKLVSELETKAARTHEEKAILEDQLARCLNETHVLHKQINEMADHQVSKMASAIVKSESSRITMLFNSIDVYDI